VTSDRDRSILLLLTGSFAVWLALSGVVLNFVRPSMRPFVLAAGAISVLLAVLPPGGLLGRGGAAHDHDHGEPGVGWLLLVPLLVVLLVPPAPLGANAVHSRLATARSSTGVYPRVRPPVRGAVPMSMAEFETRALRDRTASLRGVRVRLTGFVSRTGTSYDLSRFVIFCCAADAEAVEIAVTGDRVPHKLNEWVELEGIWVPAAVDATAVVVRALSVRTIKRPRAPYEYTTVWTG
jgi:uncharacterized repeat protein (TIGR03943 family)